MNPMKLDRRFMDLVEVELPIIQAPMAGSSDAELAIAVSEAGVLGSIPYAMLTPHQLRSSVRNIQQRTTRPINLNFFCHRELASDDAREEAWRARVAHYYSEFGIDASAAVSIPNRRPFDEEM